MDPKTNPLIEEEAKIIRGMLPPAPESVVETPASEYDVDDDSMANEGGPDVGFIDPFTILMIISIIISIIQVIQECRKRPREIKAMSNLPTSRRQINRIVLRHMGPIAFAKHGHEVVDVIVKRGEDIDPGRLQKLQDALAE